MIVGPEVASTAAAGEPESSCEQGAAGDASRARRERARRAGRSSLPQMSRVGVCSWSLGVASVEQLERLLPSVGTDLVAVGCGDPAHGTWEESDEMPEAFRAAGIRVAGAMIAFAGEDYSSPVTLRHTGGLTIPATRAERIARVEWALERTLALGATELTTHAGHIPAMGEPEREGFMDALGRCGELARAAGVVLCLETGTDAPETLAACLAELGSPSLMVNFDPANLVMGGHGDPIAALRVLAPFVRAVHVKDGLPPEREGEWGREMPVGEGAVDLAAMLGVLTEIGYTGPLCIEREGNPEQRVAEVAAAVARVRAALS